jgi:hypothetical protein
MYYVDVDVDVTTQTTFERGAFEHQKSACLQVAVFGNIPSSFWHRELEEMNDTLIPYAS